MDPGNLRGKCQGFYLIAPTCYLQLHFLHQLLNSKPYHSAAGADDNLFIPFFFLFSRLFHPPIKKVAIIRKWNICCRCESQLQTLKPPC
jgi:hypothetical protein